MRVTPLRVLLALGILFFGSEAVLHAFGLPVLEHDKIWQVTSDGYIATMALAFAGLMAFVAYDAEKYRPLFYFLMGMVALAILNGFYITASGGYSEFFSVTDLDNDLRLIGVGALLWYPATWVAWGMRRRIAGSA
jgi:hypothetical protein